MKSSQKNSEQTYIWIAVAVLIIIVIGVIVWFLTKKKENFKIDDEDEDIEDYENNELIENYLIEGYSSNFIENFQLLQLKNNNCHPVNDNFNKILHIANVICHSESLDDVRKEAERIGFNQQLAERVLNNEQNAKNFSNKVHFELSKSHQQMIQLIDNTAPELMIEIKKNTNLPKVENFSLELYQEDGHRALNNMLKRKDKIIRKLKNALYLNSKKLDDIKKILYQPEVGKISRKIHLSPAVLNKILCSREELSRFLNNETTLENYSPEDFIENYSWGSFIHSVRHAFTAAAHWVRNTAVSIGNKIASAAKSVGHWAEGIGEKIKNGIVNAYESVKHVAVEAFDKIKEGIMTAINAVVNAAKWIAEMGKEIFEKIKELVIKAVHKFADVMKILLGKILQPYLKIQNCPAGSNPCYTTVVINDKKLETLVINKLEDLIFTEFAPEIEILLKLPFVGGKIRGWITELIQPVFTELIWSHITPILGDIATGIIHAIVPIARNIKIQFAEWFELPDALYEQHFRDVFFNKLPDKYREFIRSRIKKCQEDLKQNGEHMGTNLPTNHCHVLVKNQHKHLLKNSENPEQHLDNNTIKHKNRSTNLEEEKIKNLLKYIVKPEFGGKQLDKLTYHVLQIAKAKEI